VQCHSRAHARSRAGAGRVPPNIFVYFFKYTYIYSNINIHSAHSSLAKPTSLHIYTYVYVSGWTTWVELRERGATCPYSMGLSLGKYARAHRPAARHALGCSVAYYIACYNAI